MRVDLVASLLTTLQDVLLTGNNRCPHWRTKPQQASTEMREQRPGYDYYRWANELPSDPGIFRVHKRGAPVHRHRRKATRESRSHFLADHLEADRNIARGGRRADVARNSADLNPHFPAEEALVE